MRGSETGLKRNFYKCCIINLNLPFAPHISVSPPTCVALYSGRTKLKAMHIPLRSVPPKLFTTVTVSSAHRQRWELSILAACALLTLAFLFICETAKRWQCLKKCDIVSIKPSLLTLKLIHQRWFHITFQWFPSGHNTNGADFSCKNA